MRPKISYLFSLKARGLAWAGLLALFLSLPSCAYLLDKAFPSTSPRVPKEELQRQEAIYDKAMTQVGRVDRIRELEMLVSLVKDFQGLPGVQDKYRMKVILAAMSILEDSLESQKLDTIKGMLASAMKAQEPSLMLASIQAMQSLTLKRELEARMPQMVETAEKGINWLIPMAAGGGPVVVGGLGFLAYLVRLLHRSQPSRKGEV